jgi:mannose-1-phosphate guanylyltransferase
VAQRVLREIACRLVKEKFLNADVGSKHKYYLRSPGLIIAQTFSEVFFKTSPETGVPIRCGIILAAGDGNRLRRFVEKLRGDALPKQYVNFIGKRSMLEHTFCRAQKMIPAERLFTVVSQSHLRYPEVARQLSTRPMARIVEQPDNRDTGPGLLLPLAHLYKRYPDSIVVVFPSDHFILEEDRFMAYVDQAFRIVEKDPAKLVLLGMHPSEAEPEYGYIVPGKKLYGSPGLVACEVSRFIEKPDRHVARDLISGGGLWNTLVMIFRTKFFLKEIDRINPRLFRFFARIWNALGTPAARDVVKNVYEEVHPVNLSKGFLEILAVDRPSRLIVLPVRGVRWSDWGSEQRIVTTVGSVECQGSRNGFREKEFPRL